MTSNQQRLSGKIAVVTGAGAGLGRAISEILADEGAHIIVNDIFSEPARLVAEAIREKGGRANPVPSTYRIPRKWTTPFGKWCRTMGASIYWSTMLVLATS